MVVFDGRIYSFINICSQNESDLLVLVLKSCLIFHFLTVVDRS